MIYYNNSSIIFLILTIFIGQCISFPQMALQLAMNEGQSSSYDFQPPGPNDIRGPCPGLNTAANHGYINRGGITTFDELVQMQQELYNFGLDLAIVLATFGVALDGNIITGLLSIGGKSSEVEGLLNTPGGLDTHGTFEGDASLTRNDFFLANGNNYEFNATLYGMMYDAAQKNDGLYNETTMAEYRYQRYQQSLNENGYFLFPPQSLLLYGAAAFLYEAFPNRSNMLADETVISSFFGAESIGDRQWKSVPERIPANWTKRETPYTLADVSADILELYLAHPVPFGGNVGGEPNTFEPGNLQLTPDQQTVSGLLCFLYRAILTVVPSQVQSGVTMPADAIFTFLTENLDPVLGVPFGCPASIMNLQQI